MRCVLALASVTSHLTVGWLRIKASWGNLKVYGRAEGKATTIVYGSSVANSGIDWEAVANRIGTPVGLWSIAGSTPSEWEQMHRGYRDATRTIVVVSADDLNEYSLCDFRAEMVPLGATIRELWSLVSDGGYARNVLSQYPIAALRVAFPTVGRSDGVMTGIRDQLNTLLGGRGGGAPKEAVAFGPNGDVVSDERVSDWDPGRRERRMVLARAACGDKQGFAALKRAALERIIATARREGPTTVVVLPMSPYYLEAFFDEAVSRQFEEALSAVQRRVPEIQWVRLDRLPILRDNDMFFDFVHLNRTGQRYATEALLEQLAVEPLRP